MTSISQPGVQNEVPYGKRLLPTVLAEIAKNDPNRVFSSIARTSKIGDGFREVTYEEFVRSTNRAAMWLEDLFGRSSSFETLGYIGLFDLRYYIMVLAANKVGFKLLLPSPRDSVEAQLNLLRLTSAKAIITSRGYPVDLLPKASLPVEFAPELDDLLAKGEVRDYPYTKSFEEGRFDPWMVLQTSGSTGLPKPVILTQGWFAALDSYNHSALLDGMPAMPLMKRNKKICGIMPTFGVSHPTVMESEFQEINPRKAAGVILGLCAPVCFNAHFVWAPAARPFNAALVDEMLEVVDANICFLPPSIINELARSASSRAKLEKLEVLGFGGGPLSRQAGNSLCHSTYILNAMGSTELCALPAYKTAPEDWQYLHYSPHHKGIEFRPVGDGLYEMVIVRHPSTDPYHAAWYSFPDKKEHSTSDLFTKHPSKPNHWLYAGRAEDLIVLSNGKTLNPTSMEATISEHLSVQGVLVIGQGQSTSAAIIELRESAAATINTAEARAQVIDELWLYIAKANKDTPSHAQLARDKVVLSTPGKLFLRAGKGTIQRPATRKAYSDEIEQLYKRGEEGK
ncbi:hypothetical protein BP6252_11114 [Coleophoma cylindrospora]|uniref:AMP-dependent synthetase/ligase domain-containing protein n=1 Tax=Coleophoma cylindrospora TaxID=1849047 RepID=A0A3D8QP47_9HELO|nr:hypothetical protein BP6252_11114 [Coleophoma cylindrospora]